MQLSSQKNKQQAKIWNVNSLNTFVYETSHAKYAIKQNVKIISGYKLTWKSDLKSTFLKNARNMHKMPFW